MAMPLPPNLAALVASGKLAPDAANSRMQANRPDWIAAHGGGGGPAPGGGAGAPILNMPPPGAGAPGAPTVNLPPPGVGAPPGISGSSGAPDIQTAIQGIKAQLGQPAAGGPQAGNMGRYDPTPINPGDMGPGSVGPGAGQQQLNGPTSTDEYKMPFGGGGPMPPNGKFPIRPGTPPGGATGIGIMGRPGDGMEGADSGGGMPQGGPAPDIKPFTPPAGVMPPTQMKPGPGTMLPPAPPGGIMRPPIVAPVNRGNPMGGIVSRPPGGGRGKPVGKMKPQNRVGQMYQNLVMNKV